MLPHPLQRHWIRAQRMPPMRLRSDNGRGLGSQLSSSGDAVVVWNRYAWNDSANFYR